MSTEEELIKLLRDLRAYTAKIESMYGGVRIARPYYAPFPEEWRELRARLDAVLGPPDKDVP